MAFITALGGKTANILRLPIHVNLEVCSGESAGGYFFFFCNRLNLQRMRGTFNYCMHKLHYCSRFVQCLCTIWLGFSRITLFKPYQKILKIWENIFVAEILIYITKKQQLLTDRQNSLLSNIHSSSVQQTTMYSSCFYCSRLLLSKHKLAFEFSSSVSKSLAFLFSQQTHLVNYPRFMCIKGFILIRFSMY